MKNEYITFDYKKTGENHIKAKKQCEDACGSRSVSEEGIHICVVADGHGGDDYPRADRGSKFAVTVAMQCLLDFSRKVDPIELLGSMKEDIIKRLEGSILNGWYKLVEDDYGNAPFLSSELESVSEKNKSLFLSGQMVAKAYGTTLIAFVITNDFALGLQIGDGKCVTVGHDGQCKVPIPSDSECQLNLTTSICDSDAISKFRDYISTDLPIAVFCGSDGVEDSYSSDEELKSLYRSMAIIFGSKGENAGREEIQSYLPKMTKRGSGDDVSIAGIINMSSLPSMTKGMEHMNRIFNVNNKIDEKTRRKEILIEMVKEYRDKIEEETRIKEKKEHSCITLKNTIKSLMGQKEEAEDSLTKDRYKEKTLSVEISNIEKNIEKEKRSKKEKDHVLIKLKNGILSSTRQLKTVEDSLTENRNREETLTAEIVNIEKKISSMSEIEAKKREELEKVSEDLDRLLEEKRLLESPQLVGSIKENPETTSSSSPEKGVDDRKEQ